jgi:hypothetical protein
LSCGSLVVLSSISAIQLVLDTTKGGRRLRNRWLFKWAELTLSEDLPELTMDLIQSDQPKGKLQFKAFRERHFGPDKIYHWNSLFMPNGGQWQSGYQGVQQHVNHNSTKTRQREPPNEKKMNKRVRIVEETSKISKHNGSKLSEQAIEIFRFSEAWRRESKTLCVLR